MSSKITISNKDANGCRAIRKNGKLWGVAVPCNGRWRVILGEQTRYCDSVEQIRAIAERAAVRPNW